MNRTATDSPFLTVPPGWRFALIAYLVLYQAIFPVFAAIGDPSAQTLLLPRVALQFVHVGLTIWPLVFYRREYGFLHPLILPTLLAIFENVAKYPIHLFAPLTTPMVEYIVPTRSIAQSLNMADFELASVRFWHEALQILGLLVYYLGYFFLPIFKAPVVAVHDPVRLSLKCAIITLLCVAVGLGYIQFMQGGISHHLIMMRTGRAALFEGEGQFLTIAEFSVIAVLVWFAYLRTPFANPFWIAGLAMAIMISLVISGSRSGVVYAIVVLMLLWWRRRNRVLLLPSAALGVAAVLIFGIFGAIRQDWGSQSIDVSVFSPTQISQNFEHAATEFNNRSDEEGDLAAFAGAKNGLLWGRSYLGAASFWIPRAIWKDKPHGAGAYNMWTNFAGYPLDKFGTAVYWGIPVEAITEAFWNFHIPGVIFFMSMYGAFHRWLSDLVIRNPAPIVLIFSIWMSTHFFGDTNSFVLAMRDIFFLLALSYALGILRFDRRRAGPSQMAATALAR